MTNALADDARLSAPLNSEPPASAWLPMMRWPLIAASVAGLIAWVSTDLLAWRRDVFLLPYVLSACIILVAFERRERVDVRAMLTRNRGRTAIVTVSAAALMILTVLLQSGAPRAQGDRLVFEIVWDGIAYGAVDGLLLTAIPMVAVTRVRATAGLATDALALLASIFVFVVYHLGFAEFRGVALVAPVVAGIVFGATYLACRNPLAPILAHAAMHVAAVLHGPAGTVQLPPHY